MLVRGLLMILTGKFEKEYVFQLDMYLSEVIGMSAKDIRAKGFNAVKKIAFLRKCVLRNCSNLDQSYVESADQCLLNCKVYHVFLGS